MSANMEETAWAELTAADMMQKGMVTIPLDATAKEIEQVLVENKVSGVPVHDVTEKIVGIVSWRDVMEYFADDSENDPRNPHAFYRFVDDETMELGTEVEVPLDETVTARDMMSNELLCVRSTAKISEVAKLMVEQRIHRVLVNNPFGDVVGIVSTLDILRALAG